MPTTRPYLYTNPNKPHHRVGVDVFERVLEKWPDVEWRNVDIQKAPWHLHGNVAGHLVNAWPCANKIQVAGKASVYGEDAIFSELAECLENPAPEKEAEVVEEE